MDLVMKRNDIGDSCLLWLLERVLATRGVHPRGRTITPPCAGKHSAQRHVCRHANHWKCPVVIVSIPLAPADFPREANVPGAKRRVPRFSCAAAWMISLRDSSLARRAGLRDHAGLSTACPI